jgi:HEPN domain-containing protein
LNAQEKYEYWLETAQYDLETAKAMLNTGRWLYVVFMCQQAVEKLVKGLYILYIDDNVPRTHNIRSLVDKFTPQLSEPITEDRYSLFEDLTYYYINGRYTDYQQNLRSQLTEEKAAVFYSRTEEAFTWLLTLKP